MKEIWKSVVGYEGYYEASSMGRIRSVQRVIKSRFGTPMVKRGVVLHPSSCGSRGYQVVTLARDGKFHYCTVHRLVALAFIPNPGNKPEVNHIDTNKLNNRVSNLEWLTHMEHCQHTRKAGSYMKCLRGEETPQAKLSEEGVRRVLLLLAGGRMGREISQLMGVSEATISLIKHGKTWAHIPRPKATI